MFQRGGGVIACSQPRPTSKQRFPLICPDPGCQGRRTSVRLFRVQINCRGRADAAMEMDDVRSRSPRCAYVCACKSGTVSKYITDVRPTILPSHNEASTPPASSQTTTGAGQQTKRNEGAVVADHRAGQRMAACFWLAWTGRSGTRASFPHTQMHACVQH